MDDAPMEEFAIEHPKRGLDRLRKLEAHMGTYSAHRHVTAAVNEAGEIGGFTIFVNFPEEPTALDIWDTGVTRAHRGKGLGLRLKADATLWMIRDFPDAGWTHTFNSQVNEHMLAVNRRLGYQAANREEVFEFACHPDAA